MLIINFYSTVPIHIYTHVVMIIPQTTYDPSHNNNKTKTAINQLHKLTLTCRRNHIKYPYTGGG